MSLSTIDIGDALEQDTATLRLPRMTDAEFLAFCERNPEMRIEQNYRGDIVLMAPGDGFGSTRNAELIGDLILWNRQLSAPGMAFGSDTLFVLPNGAKRGPDAAWMPLDRWQNLPAELRAPFPHIAPDFIIELMSPSDRLLDAQRKMEEWVANGVRLGWLIDRKQRQVHIYRPFQKPEVAENPDQVSGEPELPGFVLPMERVFAEL